MINAGVRGFETVAEAAGVSVTTASNAYNKPDQMSREVRERILAAARALGYAGPNAAARSLRSRRAGAIGVLFSQRLSYAFYDPYTSQLLAGLAEVAEEARSGLGLIPLMTDADTPDEPSGITASVEAVRQAVIDGLVAYCVEGPEPALDVARSRDLPIVETLDGRASGGC